MVLKLTLTFPTAPSFAAWLAKRAMRLAILVLISILVGCSHLPPGASYRRHSSSALAEPLTTKLGRHVAELAQAHPGLSGFRIVPVGVDGFLTRAQIIDTAEKTLDLQYYIYRSDETGRLISAALARAAARGVRVRLLLDDGDTKAGDERVMELVGYPGIEVRIFNPFIYRGHSLALRAAEFLLDYQRLDHRMHNKLLVVDNVVAMVGGRNIGNQYFQMDPEAQFADDDVFAAGPIVSRLSASFDEFWNHPLAIPAAALLSEQRAAAKVRGQSDDLALQHPHALGDLQTDGVDYGLALASGEPYAGMLSGRLPLEWAQAQVLSDSPGKRAVVSGSAVGRLLMPAVLDAARAAQSEILIVTPYFVPAEDELQLFAELRARQVRIRVLTNSMESSHALLPHSGYVPYRAALLAQGVEIYEVRSLLSSARGSGQTPHISAFGTYALHAKLYVFDGRRLFIGSMNFDQRSRYLNTEVGLMIESPLLAQQTAERFAAMSQAQNSYVLALRSRTAGSAPALVWQTREADEMVEYRQEPARHWWDGAVVRVLSWLPIAGEL